MTTISPKWKWLLRNVSERRRSWTDLPPMGFPEVEIPPIPYCELLGYTWEGSPEYQDPYGKWRMVRE